MNQSNMILCLCQLADGIGSGKASADPTQHTLPAVHTGSTAFLSRHNIKKHVLFDSIHLICNNPALVDYFGLPEVERERYDWFIEAYCAKCKVGQL